VAEKQKIHTKRRKNNQQKHTLVRLITVTTCEIEYAINSDSNLAALLTTVTLGKLKLFFADIV